jgi:hypothetical protein
MDPQNLVIRADNSDLRSRWDPGQLVEETEQHNVAQEVVHLTDTGRNYIHRARALLHTVLQRQLQVGFVFVFGVDQELRLLMELRP